MKRILFAIVFMFALLPSLAIVKADEVALRWYIVPITLVNGNARYASHFGGKGLTPDPELVGVEKVMMDYGIIDVGLIAANVTAAQITYLNGLSDIIVIPANIDNQIGANLATVKSKLAAFNIPSVSITGTDTYRKALREIAGEFEFMARLTAITLVNPTTLNANVLSITYGSLPQNWKNALQQAASELNYSTQGITGSSTMGDILTSVGNQNDNRIFNMLITDL